MIEGYPIATAYLRAVFGGADEIDTTVHPNDEMLFAGGELDAQDPDSILTLYFRNGVEMCAVIEQVVRWRFGGFGRVGALLDFASGYGRLTRFLVKKLPPSRIAVADVVHEAVEFQASQFGVTAIRSTIDPRDFACERRFDVIFAASLFTHLPESTFAPWLERLTSLLTPRGVLAFTTHSPETFDWSSGLAAPQHEEFFFVPLRCSGALDPHDYGNTWISEARLRRLASGHSLMRIPRGLSNGQDLWILTRESAPAIVFDTGVFGTPDSVRLCGAKLTISGWVATRSRLCPIRRVIIEAAGRRVAELTSLSERPDVAAYWRDDAYLHSGWCCTIDLNVHAVTLDDSLIVRVRTSSGIEWIGYAGTISTAALRAKFAYVVDAHRRFEEAGRRAQLARERALQERVDALARAVALPPHS